MDRPPVKSVAQKQASLNRSTSGQWGLYASHRQEIEKLIAPSAPGQRLCVLGAGNCNDLDLSWLVQAYAEVHLADIDADALQRASARQRVEGNPKLKLHAPIDLGGIAHTAAKWHERKPTEQDQQDCQQQIRASDADVVAQLPGPFDRVVSPCVLSQLLTPLRDHLTEAHPAFESLLSAMRQAHLRIMLDLLAPGGQGVLVTDLLSSASFGDLARVPQDRLNDFMRSMLDRGRFFSGLDPTSLNHALAQEPDVSRVSFCDPWNWHLGLSKTYLVYGITFRRTGGRGAQQSAGKSGLIVL